MPPWPSVVKSRSCLAGEVQENATFPWKQSKTSRSTNEVVLDFGWSWQAIIFLRSSRGFWFYTSFWIHVKFISGRALGWDRRTNRWAQDSDLDATTISCRWRKKRKCENHLWLREYFNRMIQFSFDNVLFLMRVGPMVNGSVKCLMLNVLFSILFIEDLFCSSPVTKLGSCLIKTILLRNFHHNISTRTRSNQHGAAFWFNWPDGGQLFFCNQNRRSVENRVVENFCVIQQQWNRNCCS